MMLDVSHLTIEFRENGEEHDVVKDVSFSIGKGDIVGIIGESGSGKTMTALTIMGLLKRSAIIEDGAILFEGKNLLTLSRSEMRGLQGDELAMIFQEPMTSLNPTMRVGDQVEEALRVHTTLSDRERKERAYEVLSDVELDPDEVYRKYPYELSGGMRQRVMIAAALIMHPQLLIADEPTTALDIGVQDQILQLLKKLNKQYDMAILFISHDLRIVRDLCKRVLIMRSGEIVEQGEMEDIFMHPNHPYTKELLHRYEREKVQAKADAKTILSVRDLSVSYGKKEIFTDVSFDIHEKECVGLIGRSGCGKSTLANCILGFVKQKSGTVEHFSKLPQMVFQDPYSSLNPKHTIGWILEEPLRIAGKGSKEERRKKVCDMLEKVELPASFAERKPAELSGGQRQRISIALALINDAKFIVIDEGLSALDVTVQQQIMSLLTSLQEELHLSYLFISHDKDAVSRMCNRILFMENGRLTELSADESVFDKLRESVSFQMDGNSIK